MLLKVNILDQSPVSENFSFEEALNNTLELAKLADSLGYSRYWVAEHHNTKSFACASPEILIGRIASLTSNLRVGSGGVLLNHYSPFKIAEQFNMLQVLYPNRIDLGIGRATGADEKTTKALQPTPDNENPFNKFDILIDYIKNSSSNNFSFKKPNAVPFISKSPELWVLGTSPQSALYAAQKGLPYAFANFINDLYCVQSLQTYYQNFQPSIFLNQPYVNLAIFALCAETDEKAKQLAKSSEAWLIDSFLYGKNIPFPSLEKANERSLNFQEQLLIEHRKKSAFIGTADFVAEQIQKQAKQLAIHEVTIVTITYDHEDKLNSYKLLAEALKLSS